MTWVIEYKKHEMVIYLGTLPRVPKRYQITNVYHLYLGFTMVVFGNISGNMLGRTARVPSQGYPNFHFDILGVKRTQIYENHTSS